MKFKNYIETESGIKDTSTSPGTAGQVLSSTVTGTDWIDQGEIIAAAATLVVIKCKNRDVITLVKGTPVYQTGTVGATDVIEVARGSALISDGAQPSIGLLQQDLDVNEIGFVVITGELLNVTTSPIDGLTPVTGQKVFVKSGGGLTLTKPTTELNTIQNMGLIGKVSGGNAGSITVSSIMRTNDVPNLPTGRIWIGDGNTIVSDTVYVDEPNNRVGIGTSSPNSSLEVAGEIDSVGGDGYLVEGVRWARGNSGLLELGDWAGLGYNTSIFGSNSALAIRTLGSNVGIGTTNPSAKLDVVQATAANGAAALHLIGPNTNAGLTSSVLIIEQGDGKKITMDGNDIDVSSGDLFINDYSLEDVTFGGQIKVKGSGSPVGNSYIANGNFGIGTTSPFSKLEVNGDTSNALLTLKSTNGGTNDAFMRFYEESNGASYSVGLDSSQSLFAIAYGTDGNTLTTGQRFVINAIGNVGIGTTSPSQKLHVVGSGYFQNGGVFVGTTSNSMFNYFSSFIITAGSGQTIALGGGPGGVNNNVLIGNGNLKVSGSVQLANDTAAASASKVGTFKYYTSGNNSYVDMCMQTGASTYAWVNIVTNSW